MPYRFPTIIGLAALSLLGLANATRPALAADLDYGDAPPPVAEQSVEFGSGWYIRGDIAYTKRYNASTTHPTFDTTDPASIPVAPTLDLLPSSDAGYTASIGGGYKFNNWFRTDAVFDFHQPLSSTFVPSKAGDPGYGDTCPGAYLLQANGTYVLGQEGCIPHYTAAIKSYDVLVNGYLDIGTWSSVTPYVGAGVGLAFGHYSASADFFQTDGTSYNVKVLYPPSGAVLHEDFDTSSSGNYYNFAYALMAGVSVDVFDHTKLDVGYRYLNMGKVDGQAYFEHQIHAGLRYMIDN